MEDIRYAWTPPSSTLVLIAAQVSFLLGASSREWLGSGATVALVSLNTSESVLEQSGFPKHPSQVPLKSRPRSKPALAFIKAAIQISKTPILPGLGARKAPRIRL